MTESKWPDFEMPAPDEYLIALGAFSLLYNEAEMALWSFFKHYLTNVRVRDYLFEALHNRGRIDLIQAFADEDENPEFVEAVRHGLNCFNSCCENRNVVMHAFPLDSSFREKLQLLKRKREKPGSMKMYDVQLEDIQASATAARETMWYFFGLHNWLVQRDAFKQIGRPPDPLPDRPQRPRILIPSPPQVDPEGEQPPPEAERG